MLCIGRWHARCTSTVGRAAFASGTSQADLLALPWNERYDSGPGRLPTGLVPGKPADFGVAESVRGRKLAASQSRISRRNPLLPPVEPSSAHEDERL